MLASTSFCASSRRQQEGHHSDGFGFPSRLRLNLLAGGKDLHVLQHDLRLRLRYRIAAQRDQNVDMGAGKQKPGHTHNFVRPYRGGPHAFGDLDREPDAGARRRQIRLQDWLPGRDRVDDRPTYQLFYLGESAFQRQLRWPLDQAQAVRFQHFARL